MCLFGGFSFNRVNFVTPLQESDTCLLESDIPIIVNLCFLQHVQISMSRPGHINVFQRNGECFFFRHTELNSRFNVMTIDEVTLD